jgi:hypothetical protein
LHRGLRQRLDVVVRDYQRFVSEAHAANDAVSFLTRHRARGKVGVA